MAGVPDDLVASSKYEHLAISIVQTLQDAGFLAYFAGGWVRDFLVGAPCKDIDIATSARPEELLRLFPRSVTVGVQFGVVRVLLGGHEFEVATFRSDDQYIDGRRPKRVDLHSSPQQDACRRDFTINGMFYEPVGGLVLDFVGGQEDLKKKTIRAIGDPKDRFREDRLRVIRAIRFKNILSFSIDKDTWGALCLESASVAESVSPERVWQELHKMATGGVLAKGLQDMGECGLLQVLFPCLQKTDPATIRKRLSELALYSGQSVVAGLCLLFQEKEKHYIGSLGDAYRLSRRERKVADLFLAFDGDLHSLSTLELVKMYARPEFDEYLLALACTKDDPEAFLKLHRGQQEELRFWVDQARAKLYLVAGEDLRERGIQSGVEMGRLLEKAFEISVKYRLKTKEDILARL